MCKGVDLPPHLAPVSWALIALRVPVKEAESRPQSIYYTEPRGPRGCGSRYLCDLITCHCLALPLHPNHFSSSAGSQLTGRVLQLASSLPLEGRKLEIWVEKKGVKWLFRLWESESEQLKKCQSKWELSCIAESVKNAAILAALNEIATTFLAMYSKEYFTQTQKETGARLCIPALFPH